MEKKKVIIVHGCGGSSNNDWIPWLKEELKKRDLEVIALDMPDTEKPEIAKWVGFLSLNIKSTDKNLILVGHSIGCQAILRYLEKTNKKVEATILVAPWMHLDEQTIKEEGEESIKISKPWMETLIDFNKIRMLSKFVCIFSDNDPYVPLSDEKLFMKELNAKTIIEKNKGHFNDARYPVILNTFLEMVK